MSNAEKSKQLGMSFGTAGQQLRKNIMFELIKKCNLDTCYQCGEKIESVDNLSIEHKTPWLHSDNPVELFFDIDNIAFSHLKCNVLNKRMPIKRFIGKCGFIGVSYYEGKKNEYRAEITVHGKRIYIGYYPTAKEAAIEVDKVLIKELGENAMTNKSLGLIKAE
jgi:hypothetical protein